MKRYVINGQQILLYDEKLWVLKEPELVAQHESITTPPSTAKPKKKRGWKSGMPPRKRTVETSEEPTDQDLASIDEEQAPTRKSRERLTPEDFTQIKQMINADYPIIDIARKFSVSLPYVYQIKTKMRKEGELTIIE